MDEENKEGKYLVIAGGCIQPFMPYKHIIEIDLNKNAVSGIMELDSGIVSHDSFIIENKLYLFGGSNGKGFNDSIYRVCKGKFEKI